MSSFSHTGSELQLFEKAVNWKTYWHKQLLPYIGELVLEVGAGTGTNTVLLAGESTHRLWVCLEPDASLCAQLRTAVSHLRRVSVIGGTTACLELEQRFDTILYIDVLEHIENDSEELQCAANHLLSGGHLIVVSPAHQYLYTPFDRAIGHFRRYSRSSLSRAAPPEVSPVVLRYLDAAGMLASLVNRLLLKQSMPTEAQIKLWDRCLIPVSRFLDPTLGHRVGKSLLAIWRRE
jgi:SAM-dependent methyltransferase